MLKTTTKNRKLPKLYCSFFGHDFEVSKNVTSHVKEYTCKHCQKELTTNVNGNLTALTPKYREINTILEELYQKKSAYLSQKTIHS